MSKKLKLSQWHDGSVKPVHVGVYEGFDNVLNKSFFSYWDGEVFNGWWNDICTAIDKKTFGNSSMPIPKWRGIVK